MDDQPSAPVPNTNDDDGDEVDVTGVDFPIPKPDITTTHSPQSDEVKFNHLNLFSVETLTAGVYYHPKDPNQKPIALAVMGYGVPGFPDLTDDEDVERATNRSKSHMFNMGDIYPETNRGKSYLQKEVMRRALVKKTAKGSLPKPKHWTVATCIDHL